ncbi:MAG: Ger(x)C family spore germination protein [Pelosinus sp.]|nr:Ger(x)C family spore germination protein [Pelosinus sp.]
MLFAFKIAIPVILLFICTGCYGAKETDSVAYVIAHGVDKAPGGKLTITTQIAPPAGPGKSEQENIGVIDTITIPSSGQNRTLISSTLSRTLNSTHLTAIIISEEAARAGIAPILAFFSRNREFRDSIYFIVVPGSAADYIQKNTSRLNLTISRLYENYLTKKNYSLPSTLHTFYTSFKNNGSSPYITYSAVNPRTGEDKSAGYKTPQQKSTPYIAGGIPRAGTKTAIEFLGLAVFKDDKMVGVLNSEETRAVSLLRGEFSWGYLGVVDPLAPQKDFISLKVYTYNKPKITAYFNNKAPVFTVKLKLELEVLGITSGTSYEKPEYRRLLETQVADLLKEQILSMLKHTQALGTDPVGFGLYLRPQLDTTAELSKADLTELYQQADIQIDVTAKMRRTGLIWQTTPKRNG